MKKRKITKKICPICKSDNMTIDVPQLNAYRCRDCGYTGHAVIEEDEEI